MENKTKNDKISPKTFINFIKNKGANLGSNVSQNITLSRVINEKEKRRGEIN